MLLKRNESILKFILLSLILFASEFCCRADGSPGFFLKITKNIPRLGKRYDKLMSYNAMTPSLEMSSFNENNRNYEDDDTNKKMINELIGGTDPLVAKDNLLGNYQFEMRRKPLEGNAIGLERLNLVQPINGETLIELLDKDAISGDNVKFIHWRDFDVALQVDRDLYEKVISLGRRPDQRLKQRLQARELPATSLLLPPAAQQINDLRLLLNSYKNAGVEGETGFRKAFFQALSHPDDYNLESNFII